MIPPLDSKPSSLRLVTALGLEHGGVCNYFIALIDVCSDLLIFHEFLLCFNSAASLPIACVNCSRFALRHLRCELWGRVFFFVDVDGEEHN